MPRRSNEPIVGGENINLAAFLARNVFPHFAAEHASRAEARSDFCRAIFGEVARARGLDSGRKRCKLLASADFSMSSPRLLGEVYELLLDEPDVAVAGRHRKRQGSFFTPASIVSYIVRETLRPVVERWLAIHRSHFKRQGLRLNSVQARREWASRLAEMSICDPAAGTGYFLLEVAAYIADEIATAARIADSETCSVLRQLVVAHCVAGVDIDPDALQLARLSLWLLCTPSCRPDDWRLPRLLHVDALLDDELERLAPAGFAAIVGNPPYVGHRGDFDGRPLRNRYRTCREQPNVAAAFLERSLGLLAPRGRCGLILPKALQYVANWSEARRMLAHDFSLEQLLDAREAFDGVLLEQSIVIAERSSPRTAYHAGDWATVSADEAPSSTVELTTDLADDLDCLPAVVDPRSLALWNVLRDRGPRLGDISRTSQALGYQADLNRTTSGDALPIHRGRQVQPLRIDPATDTIARDRLLGRDGRWTAKVGELFAPKIVSQNIVAHVTRPRPRVWIISAADERGVLCLNTISATWLRDARFSRAYVSTILNSSLGSWFFSELVFCRAIRTMHLDHAYVGKLPIAELPRAAQRSFAALARSAALGKIAGPALQAKIDALVFAAYGLDERSQAFVRDYCYGEQTFHVVEKQLRAPHARE